MGSQAKGGLEENRLWAAETVNEGLLLRATIARCHFSKHSVFCFVFVLFFYNCLFMHFYSKCTASPERTILDIIHPYSPRTSTKA